MPYRGVMVAVLGAAICIAVPARALPQLGASLNTVAVDNVAIAQPRALPIGRAMLVLYEDREAQSQNEHARAVLGRINDVPQNRERFEFMAIADVAAWNWWPARNSVLSNLKDIARKHNTTIYADWHGAVRKTWGLTQHRSALVLTDATGKVRYASEGPVTDEQLRVLLAALAALGCATDEFAGAGAGGATGR
jgi:Bacterial protein of unknown function (YtfJ_HI0045)